MANRRMFSKVIANSDLFLDMPVSSQLLYFHLGMNADDDGFVESRFVMKQIGSSPDDLKLLIVKGFCLQFEDKVIVIRDWKINNEIRVDRYKPTFYSEHKKRLAENENHQYSIQLPDIKNLVLPKNNQKTTVGIPRIGKDRIGKDRLDGDTHKRNLTEIDLQELATHMEVDLYEVKKLYEKLPDYEASNGKHYRDYKATLRNWIRSGLQDGRIKKKSSTTPKLVGIAAILAEKEAQYGTD